IKLRLPPIAAAVRSYRLSQPRQRHRARPHPAGQPLPLDPQGAGQDHYGRSLQGAVPLAAPRDSQPAEAGSNRAGDAEALAQNPIRNPARTTSTQVIEQESFGLI